MSSVLAVTAGAAVFISLFVLLPPLGAAITAIPAGLIAGYVIARIAPGRETAHAGVTAGLVAAALIGAPQIQLSMGGRLLVAAIATATITFGAWIRGQAALARADETKPGEHS